MKKVRSSICFEISTLTTLHVEPPFMNCSAALYQQSPGYIITDKVWQAAGVYFLGPAAGPAK